MAFEKYIFIQLPGLEKPVPAGLFRLDTEIGVGRFDYGRRYLLRPEAISIDPVNLPLSEKSFVTKKNNGIFGAIGGLLPDSWGRFILAKKMRVPFGSLSDFELLDLVDTNAIGALSLGDTPERPATKKVAPARFGDLQDIARVYDKVLAEDDLPPEVLYLLEQGTSLGGAQPKCAVSKDGIEYVAKFESAKTFVKYPRIEYVTMNLARRAGIDIPDVRLEEIGGRAVYLIERFDREEGRRNPFLSAMALSNLDIEELDKGSYLSMATDMRKFVRFVARDLKQLFRRIVFNVLVRNQDDHLRNHGFIYTDHWSLSPAYDIVPMVAQTKGQFHLSLAFGQFGSLASRENLLSRCDSFGVSKTEANDIIEQCEESISGWEKEMKNHGVSAADLETIRSSFCFSG